MNPTSFTRVVAAALALATGTVASGAQDALPADPRRIVAIGGAVTEIIHALGEEDRLVARDSTSVYPPQALDLPDVGYIRQLSPEGVLSVDPDLIIALEGSGPPEALQVLTAARVPMVMVPERFDGEGLADKIKVVGAALGVAEAAEDLANRIEDELDVVAAEVAVRSQHPRVLFVLSMSGGRIMAAGQNTAADAIITLGGGVNVIDAFDGYRQLTDEAVIEAAPDVILMMEREGAHDAQPEQLFVHPALASTPAGRRRQAIRMDGAFLLGFGPRTAEAVRELAERLGAVEIGAVDG
jgi:iron complex transport system substrate-binding protein